MLGLALLFSGGAKGEGLPPSPSLMGPAGLNTIPTARMADPGTVTASVSTFGPYAHAAVSAQFAPALSFTLRRSGEISGKGSGGAEEGGRRPWPALDLKLRLVSESAHVPEISVGADAAFGERRTASEYLVASKRVGAFNLTAGIGWGRMGESGEVANPLRLLGGHFAKDRKAATDNGAGNGPADWLTGHRAGLFGGIEYFPSFLDNASLKLDWSSGRWRAEKALIPGFDAPAPWSVGARWSPLPWLDLGAGAAGGGVFMARASVRTNAKSWHDLPFSAARAGPLLDDTALYDPRADEKRAGVNLELASLTSFPAQAGLALRSLLLRKSMERSESLSLTPTFYGFRGPRLTLPRDAVEKALSGTGTASAEELWRSARFETQGDEAMTAPAAAGPSLLRTIQLQLDARASLSEPDAGVLHRTALIVQTRRPLLPRMGILWGTSTRLSLTDTSDRLNGLREKPEGGASVLPGRFGAGAFAGLRISMQDLFFGWTGTPAPGLYAMAVAGYVEEMYAGGGGEILWRPFGRTFALGIEGWGVVRRDPNTILAQGLLPGAGASGFLKGWYEIPGTDLTASLRAGRYLAGDIGATLGLATEFRGGARVEGWVTATNLRDRDAWDEDLPLSAGLRLILPFGGRVIPAGSAARLALEPMGRRAGAAVENPLPLYEATEPLSWRGIARDWPEISEPLR